MSAPPITQKSLYTYRVEDEALFLERRGSTIAFPIGAENFSVTVEEGKMQVHAWVDLTKEKIDQKFYLRKTGFLLDGNEGDYIGTISLFNGWFVGHLYKEDPQISSPMSTRTIIYKFPVPKEGESKMTLPQSAQKICTFVRRGEAFVYAKVNVNDSTLKEESFF